MQINIDLELQDVGTIENSIDICECTAFKDLIFHDFEVSIEEKLVLTISHIPKPLADL